MKKENSQSLLHRNLTVLYPYVASLLGYIDAMHKKGTENLKKKTKEKTLNNSNNRDNNQKKKERKNRVFFCKH